MDRRLSPYHLEISEKLSTISDNDSLQGTPIAVCTCPKLQMTLYDF